MTKSSGQKPPGPSNHVAPEAANGGDLRKLLLALQAHHFEVEVQNDQLRETNLQLERQVGTLADLYEGVPVGYVTTDRHGVILLANGRLAEMVGSSRVALSRRRLADFVAADDQDTYHRHFTALADGATSGVAELRLRGPAEQPRWARLESVAVRTEGAIAEIRSVLSELGNHGRRPPDLRVLEEQAQHVDDLSLVSSVTRRIAHDLNNVLTVVMGLASNLELSFGADNPRRQDLRDILAAGVRGQTLTRQLLDFAQPRPDRIEMVRVGELAERAFALLGRTTPNRIQLKLHIEDEIEPIAADPDRCQQLLLNVCASAVDAIPDQGVMTLVVRNVDARDSLVAAMPELAPTAHVAIEVTDHGAGVDVERLRRAFEPGLSSGDIRKAASLGLLSAHATVWGLGGGIRFDTSPDAGARLSILLPVQASIRSLRELTHDGDARREAATILIVDDDPMVRSALVQEVERLGHRVLAAEGGESALALYRENLGRIEAVLLDLSMPVMDGAVCYAKLKQIDANVRVVLCTGEASGPRAQALLEQGCDQIIGKPCSADELSQALAQAIAARRPRPAAQVSLTSS